MLSRLLLIALAVSLSQTASWAGSFPKPIEGRKPEIQSVNPDQQKRKLRQVEEAAALFIQRWHETLDIEILFNEMYVSRPVQRRRNVYSLIRTGHDNYQKHKHIDYKAMKDAFVGFFNMVYLGAESSLLPLKEADTRESLSSEIIKAMQGFEKLDYDHDNLTSDSMRQMAVQFNHIATLCRKYFPPDCFNSPLYQENLKALPGESDDPRLILGVPDFDIGNDQEVYVVRRGVFEFYFIEEDGKLKVLTLGYGS